MVACTIVTHITRIECEVVMRWSNKKFAENDHDHHIIKITLMMAKSLAISFAM